MIETISEGVVIIRNNFSIAEQREILRECRFIVQHSPFFTPHMKDGTYFNQKLTNAGEYGWVSGYSHFIGEGSIQQKGNPNYRYQRIHPQTGKTWMPLPNSFRYYNETILKKLNLPLFEIQSALLNWYAYPDGKLGLHQDKTELDLQSPIITWSLGNSCVFRVSKNRTGGTKVQLDSGDVVVMHGIGRMDYHGVLKIHNNHKPDLIKESGRLSITFRKVTL